MSIAIQGLGWVTPLGRGVSSVWERLMLGQEAEVEYLSTSFSAQRYPVMRVPPSATMDLPRHPRLRRASAISRFAALAGLDALRDGGLDIDPEVAKRIALVFAVSNGGVIYTERFYHEIVETGAQAASPLLFPETVFNAPASHLAAMLGIEGTSYTLVGDGAVGMLALKMADDLMADERLDYCLVVAAEEADWLLCDAYSNWRLLRLDPPIEPLPTRAHGMIPSEGAGAVLLGREGRLQLKEIAGGANYRNRNEATCCVRQVLQQLQSDAVGLVVVSANGTFIDAAETEAITAIMPGVQTYTAKPALGDSIGASALWQVVLAAQALKTLRIPPSLPAGSAGAPPAGEIVAKNGSPEVIISSCGLNQQVAGARLQLTS